MEAHREELAEQATGDVVADGGEVQTDLLDILVNEFFETEPSGTDGSVVREALEHVVEEEWETAAEILRDRYESICEHQRPVLQETAHPASCHLFDQP
jgi:peptide/nickel transport system ATP-binding protein